MADERTTEVPPAVPRDHAGKWIAWNKAQTKIVAVADTLTQVRQAAREAEEIDPVFAKVPRADVRFVGVAA
ncbi:MAG: DUF5678 domain-containing protein [Planctomycetales bacterium]